MVRMRSVESAIDTLDMNRVEPRQASMSRSALPVHVRIVSSSPAVVVVKGYRRQGLSSWTLPGLEHEASPVPSESVNVCVPDTGPGDGVDVAT